MFTILSLLFFLAAPTAAYVVNNGTTCYLYPESLTHSGQPVDDTPSVLQAFELCGINGTIIFTKNTFNMFQIMNTTNLLNCNVEIQGELLYSTNIPYWLSHSINVGLQNQSTAWLFGGTNITIAGGGTINGNGQVWYTQNRNNANQPRRPITITFFNSTNLFVDSIRFIQPQFWASFISYSRNVTMTNILVNATSNDEWNVVNTDGTNTWNSADVFIANWTVQNGDDCVAAKGNTTNLHVKNVTCLEGNGMTVGSVGQYPLTPDYDEDILFEDVVVRRGINAGYIKTWQGVPQDNSGNGDAGGGGSGLVRNVTFRNFEIEDVGLPIQLSQCIYSETGADICDTSKMRVEDVVWENVRGTSRYNIAASIFCTSNAPCPGIFFRDVNITSVNATLGLPLWDTNLQDEVFQCANIKNEADSGIPCNRRAPDNFGQVVRENVKDEPRVGPSLMMKSEGENLIDQRALYSVGSWIMELILRS
ncbi:glycoside hydrolase family 28 protein [Aulographum hederae CBS 113979]|uniref:galacturonan 1,4-alpha-galacturonidase n=1 Tax=Aulographum hederae CBS 113979 TaxID=1176131 RepID=A0A6G1HCU2_9PEZI|nr:glycoside hydrolase family 28 protein [Aulographum hederae CBS 113979]